MNSMTRPIVWLFHLRTITPILYCSYNCRRWIFVCLIKENRKQNWPSLMSQTSSPTKKFIESKREASFVVYLVFLPKLTAVRPVHYSTCVSNNIGSTCVIMCVYSFREERQQLKKCVYHSCSITPKWACTIAPAFQCTTILIRILPKCIRRFKPWIGATQLFGMISSRN